MEPFLDRIKRPEPLVADGAMGSLLLARAPELLKDRCSEAVNIDKPEVLEEVAQMYLDAGAELLQTNTFGGSPQRLGEFSLDHRTAEINRVAVDAVRRVAGDRAYVSASCGPTGKMLPPVGTADPAELEAGFKSQLEAIVAAGPDVICVETMMDINEAVIAVRAAKEISSRIPVMATMTFDKKPRGFFTSMGVTIETAARELAAAGADVVGSNCGNGIENMILIATEFRRFTTLPIIIQSNAGLPEVVDGELFYRESPEFMAEKAKVLAESGVSIIGGCCGTTPDHIRAIKAALRTEG